MQKLIDDNEARYGEEIRAKYGSDAVAIYCTRKAA